MARELIPGEDWDFFAAFNATTEAYDFVKRLDMPPHVDTVKMVARHLLTITDACQLLLSGELRRSSVAHARVRICLHHVMAHLDGWPQDWDEWEATVGRRVEALLAISAELAQPGGGFQP